MVWIYLWLIILTVLVARNLYYIHKNDKRLVHMSKLREADIGELASMIGGVFEATCDGETSEKIKRQGGETRNRILAEQKDPFYEDDES